ncbi:MAG TPA: DUF2147 domain-containing protein, partial [Burkholderiaceae bacterium]|nr:DUF2147 domain-containing protein [Burkholderiaceae bacterium]
RAARTERPPRRLASATALALFAVAFAAAPPSRAQATATPAESPAGLWQTIDDHSGKPAGLVRVVDADGIVSATIERVLDPSKPKDATCDKCTDERRGLPVVGLRFLRNMHRAGDRYEGGDILDPENGKVYRCLMRLVDGGKRLEVRGFIGFSLLGRTQVWDRVE